MLYYLVEIPSKTVTEINFGSILSIVTIRNYRK
jgi:hypothetical protein